MLFVFVLFITKNETIFKNQIQNNGLVFNGNDKVGDLVNRDTDLDGVPDWQESLYGTDPTKKDTNGDGVGDNVEIARLSKQNPANGELDLNIDNLGDNTATGQLAKELFSTIAALNQTGAVDQDTIDKLSATLAEKIQNPNNIKTYTISDIKISNTDDKQAVKAYNDALNKINAKYPIKTTFFDVLDKFIIDEDTVNENALLELDPIIKQTNSIVYEMSKMSVPSSLVMSHLEVLNLMKEMSENINNIKYYNTDIIRAMGGISKYTENMLALDTAVNKLANIIEIRLK